MNMRTYWTALVGIFLTLGAAAEEPKIAVEVPARLAKLGQPSIDKFFPFDARRDALVYVRFNLTAEGKVVDPELDEGGFSTPEFDRAVLRIVPLLKFEPATLNGQPVESRGLKMPFRFLTGAQSGGPVKGVTKEFRSEATKVIKLIQDKDYAGAEHHAKFMLAEKVSLSYEFAVLQATLADTYARMGQYHLALAAVREVTASTGMRPAAYTPGGPLPQVSAKDFLLPADTIGQMLKLRFALADRLGFYWDALQSHAELQALGQVVAEDPTMPRFQELLTLVRTAPSLTAHARLGQYNWLHDLTLRRFTVADVRGGSLKTISLRCAGAGRKLDYSADTEWTIPAKFGRCGISFEGDPGTEFDIIEFRDAPDTTAPGARD
jgi:TonB family protein